ncbi:uncharacterized protein C8R40DRAFT_1105311 [Lentinula edodes]|uniref:uncharacterized protein n=1 Tax=Lentinula edodes TaxID=5353 RepID=UPI001E8ED582|nr:uncharacterized protein C8R40DRAFT_1105311 [Lentinula edodes]KAH7875187.1 hypothetical protein C8R40DRAFT_1105311 [Lentinula edodes]
MAIQARNQLWATGHDETVEVNQRALIDKVLARYSGEFTVFRELLQNSDDAQSKEVEIRFETRGFLEDKVEEESPAPTRLPNLKSALVHQWTFKNDGITFREEDWNRLKKIAEGNPDEEKIGAFGVGFYSLFSVTEEPFVTSGGEWMGFHWKRDQLLARRGKLLDTAEPSKWTSFEMSLREDTPIPAAFDFTRFLASSITFMNHLSTISVYFDDKRLTRLTKSTGIPKELGLPKTLNVLNKSKMMTLDKLKSTSLLIQADVMRWVYTSGSEKAPAPSAIKPVKPPAPGGFFASLFSGLTSTSTTPHPPVTTVETPKPIDPLKTDTTSVSLTVFSADADVKVDQKLAAELHRSTKKSVPKKIKYELIYTGMDEYKASKAEDEQQTFATSGSIFQGLRADLDGMGSARIFIGHATSQTTGIGGHMSARFLPTVERESLDLMDRNVAIWNKELLSIGGTVSRAVYELEMDNIKHMSDSAGPAKSLELQTWLMDRAVHVLKFFTFHQSTPSADVSSLMEQAFFACSTGFRIISTNGIQDVADIRLPDAQFSSFLKDLPVLPEQLLTAARPMVTALQNRKLVKAITFSDVLKELRNRPLTEDESVACLTWWISLNKDGESAARLQSIQKQLLDAAVFTTGATGSKEERIIPLNTIHTILNPRNMAGNIPPDAPFPPTMLPPSFSKSFKPDQLTFAFHWTELTLVEWLRFIATSGPSPEYDLSVSDHWSERVLGILARAWPSLSSHMKDEIVQVLKSSACIPTSHGSKIPEETYFANADIFHDLPVVKLPSGSAVKGNLERVLIALGVRKHVELQIIFTRMIKTNEWTISDLIKYLVSVKDSLSAEEKARLKLTNAFSAESPPGTEKSNKRYRAEQLFEPSPIFTQLELPIIDWGTKFKWRSSSEEARFLFDLGLQRYPSLSTLVDLCASSKPQIRVVAFKYLLDNISTKYQDYDSQDFYSVKFIPATKNGSPYLGSPGEVLSGQEWEVLGLPVLANAALGVGPKLGLREHPTSAFIVSFLEETPPRDIPQATVMFNLMSNRISDLSSSQLQKLSQLSIVPTRQKKDNGIQIINIRPSQCFFGHEGKDGFHSKLFVFIDFGASANSFLSACGAKREPSVEEITLMLLADAHNFYQLAGGPNSFLDEIRNIAVNSRLLSNGTLARLKKAPVLLALQRRVSVEETSKKVVDGDEDWETQYDLKRPDQIVIADDSNSLQLFGDKLFVAPQEDILEAFYILLGSKRLSALVQENYEVTNEINNSPQAAKLQAHILERLPLFLHEHTHARTKTSFTWLSSSNNFIVRSFGKISVVKSLKFGSVNLSKRQAASVVGPKSSRGPLQIWLANDVETDMYEVATSFNRLFFETPKANDALLFMTILSTDLQALKRRGYNVERIERKYREQRAEQRKAAEERQAVEDGKVKSLMSKPPTRVSTPTPVPGTPLPGAFHEMPQNTDIPIEHNPVPPSLGEKGLNSMGRPNTMLNPFHKFSRKLGFRGTEDSLDSSPGPSVPRNPIQGATPLGNITANIDMAIKACRPESGDLLRNREQMQQVKESLNEGYCDISGRAEDLQHAGTVGALKVYLSAEVPNKQTFLTDKSAPLQRFLGIVTSLARIYSLPLTSLHIFYDLTGPLIAFNRNASIFLNLRFYEAWHDSEVAGGDFSTALVSWYFTLAHEIAHNLVQPHNSEHEFYFAAICERHVLQLGLEASKS